MTNEKKTSLKDKFAASLITLMLAISLHFGISTRPCYAENVPGQTISQQSSKWTRIKKQARRIFWYPPRRPKVRLIRVVKRGWFEIRYWELEGSKTNKKLKDCRNSRNSKKSVKSKESKDSTDSKEKK